MLVIIRNSIFQTVARLSVSRFVQNCDSVVLSRALIITKPVVMFTYKDIDDFIIIKKKLIVVIHPAK